MSLPPSQDGFALVLARAVTGSAGWVHVAWRHPAQGDRVVQVYLDGQWCDTTLAPAQHECWIWADPAQVHRVELLVVDGDDAWTGHSDCLQDWSTYGNAAKVTLICDLSLPPDTQVAVQLDGQPCFAAPLFDPASSRAGWGGLFGLGTFGFDDASAPGLGAPECELGWGPLGHDGAAWHWGNGALPTGTHEVSLAAVDAADRPVASPLTLAPIVVIPPSMPASSLRLDPDWTLRWTLPTA